METECSAAILNLNKIIAAVVGEEIMKDTCIADLFDKKTVKNHIINVLKHLDKEMAEVINCML